MEGRKRRGYSRRKVGERRELWDSVLDGGGSSVGGGDEGGIFPDVSKYPRGDSGRNEGEGRL